MSEETKDMYKKASDEFIRLYLKDSNSRFDYDLCLFVNDSGIDKEINSMWMMFFTAWTLSRIETMMEMAAKHISE